MLRLTVNMMISDIQRVFRGALFPLYLGLLGFILVHPFYISNPYSMLYLSFIVLSLLIPQLPKLFYVLPFGEKLIRRHLHLRCILTALVFLAVGGIITLISYAYPVPYIKQGWGFLTLYAQLFLLSGLIHSKVNRKLGTLLPIAGSLSVVGNLLTIFLTGSIKKYLIISIVLLITTELLLFFGLKTYRISNYVEPTNGIFRNQKSVIGRGGTAT